MNKINLNSFEVRIDRNQMRSIRGGLRDGNSTVCKVTCCDGSLEGVIGCSTTGEACNGSGGVDTCNCDYPGPFDPPPGG